MKDIIKIHRLNIEVETEISQKGKSFGKLVIPNGWRLLKVNEIIYLYNNYAEKLNMKETWEFIEQPFKENKSVARFDADSDRAVLDCNSSVAPDCAYVSLGVRFCKDLEEKMKDIIKETIEYNLKKALPPNVASEILTNFNKEIQRLEELGLSEEK